MTDSKPEQNTAGDTGGHGQEPEESTEAMATGADTQNNEQTQSEQADTAEYGESGLESDAPMGAQQPQAGAAAATPGGNKSLIIAVGIVIAALAALLGLSALGYIDLGKLAPGALSQDDGGTVATVNGEDITREDYNEQFEQTKAVFAAFGNDISQNEEMQEELRTRVLDDMINSTLLLQKAREANLSVSDEEVAEEFQNTVSSVGGEEQLEDQLSTIGLTRDELRANLREQLLVQKYLDANTDIEDVEVTEEEITTFYEQQIAGAQQGGEEAPPLEVFRGQIEQQLAQQKSSAIFNAFVEGLREEADIEILI